MSLSSAARRRWRRLHTISTMGIPSLIIIWSYTRVSEIRGPKTPNHYVLPTAHWHQRLCAQPTALPRMVYGLCKITDGRPFGSHRPLPILRIPLPVAAAGGHKKKSKPRTAARLSTQHTGTGSTEGGGHERAREAGDREQREHVRGSGSKHVVAGPPCGGRSLSAVSSARVRASLDSGYLWIYSFRILLVPQDCSRPDLHVCSFA